MPPLATSSCKTNRPNWPGPVLTGASLFPKRPNTNCRDTELHFSSARSAVIANEVALDVIHRYKYSRALWFEPFLADLLIRAAAAELTHAKWDAIVPVPLHPTKERDREFNQAERL